MYKINNENHSQDNLCYIQNYKNNKTETESFTNLFDEKTLTDSNIESQEIENRTSRKCRLMSYLYTAVEKKELEVYYQPQLDLVTNDIIGVEALLRWNHCQLGFVSPTEFIPLIEEMGLINEVTEWVLSTACNYMKGYSILCPNPLKISVNLSAHQLNDTSFANAVNRILQETNYPPELLTLELVESSSIQNIAIAQQIISYLKGLGISIAIDDFGTGYSSFSYLQQFPFDIVKIDKSFVTELGNCAKKRALVKGIIAISKSLNMKIVAEGIETSTERDFLADNQCDYGQGYFISKPLSLDQFHNFVIRYYYSQKKSA